MHHISRDACAHEKGQGSEGVAPTYLARVFLLFLFDGLFDEHLLQLLVHEIDAD
jgi:hypothetical protein